MWYIFGQDLKSEVYVRTHKFPHRKRPPFFAVECLNQNNLQTILLGANAICLRGECNPPMGANIHRREGRNSFPVEARMKT